MSDSDETLLADHTTPMRAIQRAAIVINDNTGEVVKNRYGALPKAGSHEARAIRDAHAAYKAAIGTDNELPVRLNLERVVAAAKEKR